MSAVARNLALRGRRSLAGILAVAALAAGVVASAGQAAGADLLTETLTAPDAERAGLYRAYLQEHAGAELLPDADLLRATIGFAAAACTADRLAAADAPMLATLAGQLEGASASEPTVAAAQIEAQLAVAGCLDLLGETGTSSALLQRARAAALAMSPGDVRSAAIARVADAAGLRGALPPQEIMALADAAGAAMETATLHAWAIDTLLWTRRHEIAATGAYQPADADPDDLLQLSATALDEERLLDGLLFAAAIEPSVGAARSAALERVFAAALERGDHAAARLAARAMGSNSGRDGLFAELAGQALAAGLPADADYAARRMEPSPAAVTAWLGVAAAYHAAGYPRPQQTALDAALAIARGLQPADAGSALMQVATRAADLDAIELALGLVSELPQAPDRPLALAALLRRLAETGRIAEALAWVPALDDPAAAPEIRSRGLAPLATRLAEEGDIVTALAILERHPDLAGPDLDPTQRALAVALAEAGRADEAAAALARIADPLTRLSTELTLARGQGEQPFLDLVAQRAEAAFASADAAALDALAAALADAGQLPALQAFAGQAPDHAAVRHRLAIALADARRFDDAVDLLGGIDDPSLRDAARSGIAVAMAEAGEIELAVRLARSMRDADRRVTTFRLVAEIQAHRLDPYGLVPDVYATGSEPATTAVVEPAAAAATRHPAAVAERAGIALFDLAGAVGPDWPDATGLRARAEAADAIPADVRALVVSGTADALVHREPMTASPYNEKFVEIVPILDYAQRQGEATPHLVYLGAGTVTLSQLREALLAIGRDDYLEVRNGVYTLRRPIVIGPNATLVVSAADVRELRLSTEDYAYLVSGGTLVIADTTITSWDRSAGQPTELTLGEGELLFRPFITAWSGTRTYATRSTFRALGYNNRKSWGMTASAGPQDYTFNGQSMMESPQMLLVENLFDRLYYGFYSYHSHDLDLIGNEYRNSIIYGPDPHDYSDSILMALNTAYGTEKKHGLIVSREVSGLFVGNIAFDNHGAGIMLDRLSNHSIIYANTTFANGHDGIAVYETACAVVANNRASDNDHSGLRVRNSVDVAVLDNEFSDNEGEGVVAYTDPLVEHTWRNLSLDPFWTIVSASFSGNRITGNDGAFRFQDMLAVSLVENEVMDNGDRLFAGDFLPALSTLTRDYELGRDGVLLVDACQQPIERYAGCDFRAAGVFDFDGQSDWQFADQPDNCAASFIVTSGGLIQESRL